MLVMGITSCYPLFMLFLFFILAKLILFLCFSPILVMLGDVFRMRPI